MVAAKDDQLQLMLTGARDTAIWITDRLREMAMEAAAGREREHWTGCEYTHAECALAFAANQLDPREGAYTPLRDA